jgi:endonuclease G
MHLIYAILSIILLTITSCFQTHPKAPSSRDIFSDSKSRQIPPSGNLLKLDYEGFTVWLDCEKHGAV